jgi:membrane protein implicated in regulation of membrane protease activity
MVAWWLSLQMAEQVFYLIGILATAILLVQLVLNLIGLGMHDADMSGPDGGGVDGAVGGELAGGDFEHPDLPAHSSGLGMISFRTVLAFMVGFGWSGGLSIESGISILPALLLAVLAGTAFMVVVYWLMRAIYKLSDSGNVDFRNAAGKTGTVYIPIPASGGGSGQVQVSVQDRLREIPAVTDGDEPLKTGTAVRVVKVLDGGTLIVRRLEVGND